MCGIYIAEANLPPLALAQLLLRAHAHAYSNILHHPTFFFIFFSFFAKAFSHCVDKGVIRQAGCQSQIRKKIMNHQTINKITGIAITTNSWELKEIVRAERARERKAKADSTLKKLKAVVREVALNGNERFDRHEAAKLAELINVEELIYNMIKDARK